MTTWQEQLGNVVGGRIQFGREYFQGCVYEMAGAGVNPKVLTRLRPSKVGDIRSRSWLQRR